MFQILLEELNLYITDEKELADLQILYIEKEITDEKFIFGINELIENNVKIDWYSRELQECK